MGDWPGEVGAQLLGALRIVPTGLLAVSLSRSFLPAPVGASLVLSLGFALAPGASSAGLASDALLLSTALRELSIGMVLASFAALALIAVRWAIRYVEIPRFEMAAGSMSTLYVSSALMLLLALDGPEAFVRALGESYVDVPVGGGAWNAQGTLAALLSMMSTGFATSLALALPLLVTLGLLDATLALVQRSVGGAHSDLTRSPIRSLLGLMALALLLSPLTARAPGVMREALREASSLVRQMGP